MKCGGRPLYAWVVVDAKTRKPIWFGLSQEQHKNSDSFGGSKQGAWMILLSSHTVEHGTKSEKSFKNHAHQTFEKLCRALPQGTRSFYNTQGNALHTPSRVFGAFHWYT
ncbi:hypothetical protein B9Q02_12290 [Candidatus Marsarchaeota G1 archaeon BE_D]|uniref:DDE domain-containing protein n=1 Tax=Candidatus Marsarchaeota G1 archaeon BE_D TaxID=1978156 RepID=A0A2R6A6R4_9ARCH|nr:MAG: hypothetical protein B9Q02_12290 [Candidatus Marsarchaeota G1 archaeon BE_D]